MPTIYSADDVARLLDKGHSTICMRAAEHGIGTKLKPSRRSEWIFFEEDIEALRKVFDGLVRGRPRKKKGGAE